MNVDAAILEDVGRHGITRFLSYTYRKACDHFAYARGPGLKAVERVEAEYTRLNRHLVERFSFADLCWWLSQATPKDVQQELQTGFLSDESAVSLVFGRSRRSLWEWAERDRERWLSSDFARTLNVQYTAENCPI